MRKYASSILIFLFVMGVVTEAFAISDPVQLINKGRFDLGIAGALTSNVRFQNSQGTGNNLPLDISGFYMKNSKQYYATLSYGVLNNLDAYALLGFMDGGELHMTTWQGWKAKLRSGFLWGVGVKDRLFETSSGFGVTLGVEYSRCDNRSLDDIVGEDGTVLDNNWKFSYWQFEGLATLYKRLGEFVPYIGIGILYSSAQVSGSDGLPGGPFTESVDFSAKNKKGQLGIVGLDYNINKKIFLNFQGEFMAKTSLELGLGYNF